MIDATVRWMLSLLINTRISMMTSRPMTPMSNPPLEYCSTALSSPVTANPPSASSSMNNADAAAVVVGELSPPPPTHPARASTPATARRPTASRLIGLDCWLVSIHKTRTLPRPSEVPDKRPVSLLPISATARFFSRIHAFMHEPGPPSALQVVLACGLEPEAPQPYRISNLPTYRMTYTRRTSTRKEDDRA